MAKNPADRYDTAVAFARALQRVQIELSHSVTPIDILDDAPDADDRDEDDEDDELTRVRGIVSIEPQTAPAAGPTRRRPADDTFAPDAVATTAAVAGETVLRPRPIVHRGGRRASGEAADIDGRLVDRPSTPHRVGLGRYATRSRRDTDRGGSVGRARPSLAARPVDRDRRRDRRRARHRRRGARQCAQPRARSRAHLNGHESFRRTRATASSPAPTDVTGTVSGGQVTFTWTNPDPQEGDAFIWYPVTLDGNGSPARTKETTASLAADSSGRTCIEVQLVRENGAVRRPDEGVHPMSDAMPVPDGAPATVTVEFAGEFFPLTVGQSVPHRQGG